MPVQDIYSQFSSINERNQVEGNSLPPLEDPDLKGLVPRSPQAFQPTGAVGKDLLMGGLKALSIAFEPLRRTTQAFRESVLLSTGRIDADAWRKRVSMAFSGSAELSTNDYLRIQIGKERFDKLREVKLAPWLADISNPEMGFFDKIKTGQISVGDGLSFGAELLVDPFAILAMTPAGAGVRVGAAISKVPGGAKLIKGFVYPYRSSMKAIDNVIGPKGNGILSAWNLLREPVHMWPERIFKGISGAKKNFEMVTHAEQKALQDGVGSLIKVGSDFDKRLDKFIWGSKKVAFNSDEQKMVDKVNGLIIGKLDEMVEAGAITRKKGLPLFPNIDKDASSARGALREFMPSFGQDQRVFHDITQSWSQATLGKVGFLVPKGKGLKVERATLLKGIDQVDEKQLSGITSVVDFLYGANRKLHLEPEMVKWAPKTKHTGLAGSALHKARMAAGEPEELAKAGRWQRRHITSVLNELTGKGRGRVALEMDFAVADFFQRVGGTPMGNRIFKMFEKAGFARTRDGFPGFSPTTQISGLLTHSIILNTLGLNLSSSIVNTTQTLNFAVKRGLPATIHGMLKLGIPGIKTGKLAGTQAVRKEANLLDSVQQFFKDDVWIKGAGEKYSRALMGPFTAAENLIRGTGFNVGLDVYAKQIGKPLSSILKDPKLAKKAINFATHESNAGAFIYGTLGRSPFLANPLIRPFTTLLSYPFKQAEFLRKSFVDDPTSMMRFIGLHGFLVEKLNQHANVAAEDFLGWGFSPMSKGFSPAGLIKNPAATTLIDTVQGLSAYASGDLEGAERHFRKGAETLPLVFPIPFPWLQTQELFGNPATGKQGLVDMWQRKVQQVGGDREGFVPILRSEVVTNFLAGRSTTQRTRSDLRTRKLKAERKINFTLSKRTKDLLNASRDHNGDRLAASMWEMTQPINIEGTDFYPSHEQMESRIRNLTKKRSVDADIIAMLDNKFLQRVFYYSSLEMLETKN